MSESPGFTQGLLSANNMTIDVSFSNMYDLDELSRMLSELREYRNETEAIIQELNEKRDIIFAYEVLGFLERGVQTWWDTEELQLNIKKPLDQIENALAELQKLNLIYAIKQYRLKETQINIPGIGVGTIRQEREVWIYASIKRANVEAGGSTQSSAIVILVLLLAGGGLWKYKFKHGVYI